MGMEAIGSFINVRGSDERGFGSEIPFFTDINSMKTKKIKIILSTKQFF